MGDEPIPLECLGAGRIIRCHERCTYEDKSLKRSGLSERIPLGDEDNAVGRIPAPVAIPAEFQSFSESLLLPDESLRDFEFLRNAIAREAAVR